MIQIIRTADAYKMMSRKDDRMKIYIRNFLLPCDLKPWISKQNSFSAWYELFYSYTPFFMDHRSI